MEQFDLQEYLKNPDRKIVTRDGRSARIVCTDGSDEKYPIIALIQSKDGKDVNTYTIEGSDIEDGYESQSDLLFAPKKYEGWVNIYEFNGRKLISNKLYNSKEDAVKDLLNMKRGSAITAVKIEWEE